MVGASIIPSPTSTAPECCAHWIPSSTAAVLYAEPSSPTKMLRNMGSLLQPFSAPARPLAEATRFLRLCLRPSATLAVENLFLRTQLALYQERQVTPRRATDATRVTLVWLAQWCDWRPALTVV